MLSVIELKIFLAFIGAMVITWVTIPVIIKVAELKHLFDEPDDQRKSHKKRVPTLGGIAIFAGLFITFSFFKDWQLLTDVRYLVPALIIIFFAGIKDDILVLTPIKKLLAQFISAFLVVVLGHIKINSFYGLFGLQDLSYIFSVIFTIFAILAIVNCYNLIDGADGLAGSLGVLSSLVFGVWFYLTNHWSMAFLSFSLAGSLIGFLYYNWQPAKIFMGDTGAMIIGFIISILSIHFIELNKAKSVSDDFWIHASPSVAIAVMAIPLFDMLRVFGLRLIKKASPFKPDRNHIHHLLIDLGCSHRQLSICLTVWNAVIIVMAVFLRDGKSSVLLGLLILFIFVPSVLLHLIRNKKHLNVVS